jgi:hypothetical protein
MFQVENVSTLTFVFAEGKLPSGALFHTSEMFQYWTQYGSGTGAKDNVKSLPNDEC